MSAELFVASSGRLAIQVPITMDSAAAVLAALAPQVSATDDCVLDLAAVPTVDSAALSVILGLLRAARAAGHKLQIANAPAAFDSLAALYGVDALLAEHLIKPAATAHV